MKEWKEEHCQEQPKDIQEIAPGLLIQRKDITEVVHEATDDTPEYTEYVCKSREITVSEYEMLKSIENIDSNAAIDAYTQQLIEEGLL